MATRATAVNPEILRWARERARLSIEQVAHALKKEPRVVASWEAGTGAPTLGQLEKMAESLYKRPPALFFFPQPPDEEDPTTQFRTLPEFDVGDLAPDTALAVREAQAMQLSLREITDGANPAQLKIFRDFHWSVEQSPARAANEVRAYLGLEMSSQTSWKSPEEAFKAWRRSLEENGVFVFKRAFKQKAISGFCLNDAEFPIVYVNNSTTHTRQSFTLFHELAHILLGLNGVTATDYPYTSAIDFGDDVEVWCNGFSTRVLVPEDDFRKISKRFESPETRLSDLALRYRVSRQVILRRMLDEGIVSKRYYKTKASQMTEEYEVGGKNRGSGGNYYAARVAYLGDSFLELAFSRYHEGRYSLQRLAEYLDMKVKSVIRLEDYLLGRA